MSDAFPSRKTCAKRGVGVVAGGRGDVGCVWGGGGNGTADVVECLGILRFESGS